MRKGFVDKKSTNLLQTGSSKRICGISILEHGGARRYIFLVTHPMTNL
jgi:hypothetical protein